VAFDVWNTVIKPGPKRYLLRTGTMLTTTVFFWLVVFDFHLRLLIADRKSGGHLKGFWRTLSMKNSSPWGNSSDSALKKCVMNGPCSCQFLMRSAGRAK
jgi:hypothetical protein